MIGAHTLLELRQYTLRAGRRDELMTLFRREFIGPQDALGAWVLASHTDLDDPDRFVWLRAFADREARATALERFYHGHVWQTHRQAANATILDSDNVLLLRPVQALSSGALGRRSLLRVAIHYLNGVSSDAFADFFMTQVRPRIETCGSELAGAYVSDTGGNNFPALPVREHEPVFVWLTEFADTAGEVRFGQALHAVSGWRDAAAVTLLPALMRKPEVLRLAG